MYEYELPWHQINYENIFVATFSTCGHVNQLVYARVGKYRFRCLNAGPCCVESRKRLVHIHDCILSILRNTGFYLLFVFPPHSSSVRFSGAVGWSSGWWTVEGQGTLNARWVFFVYQKLTDSVECSLRLEVEAKNYSVTKYISKRRESNGVCTFMSVAVEKRIR